MNHELDDDQGHALLAAARWYHNTPHTPFKLNGAAGTGKTHIARQIADRLAPERTVFLAPTGKAAQVLRSKGCDATTIHSAIYLPGAERRAELAALRDQHATLATNPSTDPSIEALRLAALAQVETRIRHLSQPTWTLRDRSKAFGGTLPNLIVVDEASMVSDRIAADLNSFGVPIIALGDEHQLPPVSGKPGYPGPAGATLTTIRRYADTAPLIDLATAARNRQPLPTWNGTAGRFTGTYKAEHLARFDQIICGTNNTRWAINDALRTLEGRHPVKPEPGDRIMALTNLPEQDVVNGQQATVAHIETIEFGDYRIVTTDGQLWDVDHRGFTTQDGQRAAESDRRRDRITATFARAITGHKSQGSEWPTVAVINESATFRTDAHKWLYTATTRARQQCIVLDQLPTDATTTKPAAPAPRQPQPPAVARLMRQHATTPLLARR